MASQYGLTPQEFFSFTPKQLQKSLKFLGIRVHNEFISKMRLAGQKGEYIDAEKEKMLDNMRAQGEDEAVDGASAESYLANVRDKLGVKNG